MSLFRPFFSVAIALTLGGCGAPPEPERLTPAEVMSGLAAGKPYVLADVRLPVQYREEHIDGAVSLSYHQLTIKKVEPPRTGRLVLYCACAADEESLMTAERLAKTHGIQDAAVLKGGLDAWKAAGGKTVVGQL